MPTRMGKGKQNWEKREGSRAPSAEQEITLGQGMGTHQIYLWEGLLATTSLTYSPEQP